MSYMVAQSDIDAFNEAGVVPLRGLIGARDLDRLRSAIEDDTREPGRSFTVTNRMKGAFTAICGCGKPTIRFATSA